MFKQTIFRKTFALMLVGLFLGAGIFTTIGSNTNSPPLRDSHYMGIDAVTRVVSAKLHELEKTDFSIQRSTEIYNEDGESLCYVFDLSPQGYLVVSSSYDLPPVIAYSFTSNFQAQTESNVLYEMLTTDLSLRFDTIQMLPAIVLQERHLQWDVVLGEAPLVSSRFEQWPPEGSTPTGGWILTNWHQNAPYNNFCPLDIAHGGGRSVAGCPAVAMAQILNYHNTTRGVVFDDTDDYYHNYGGNQFWIDNSYVTYGFPSFPQLNSYLDTLASHYENQIPLTNNDKAAITFACGVAATQVYGASGSGTFGVSQAYDAYQRFNCTTISLLDEDDPDLYIKLSNNIKDALPAHLAVVDPGWTMGHNVVVDGYNTDNYFHLNFGWGGSYNGWYLLPDEIPYGLTVIEGVILDILKEDTGTPDLSCNGTLEWTNVTPNNTVTSSITVSNVGEAGSNLDWMVAEWPSWGTWSFTPESGNNLKPEDNPTTITVTVIAPNEENQLFTGEVKLVNIDNTSDYDTIAVSLETGKKIGADLSCTGSLTWIDIRPGATVTGSFSVENIGKNFSNLSWEIIEWPEWGTWSLTPLDGESLTPEDGPQTINVIVIAPRKRNTEFTGQIKIVNRDNNSDYETISVTLATPYRPHFIFDMLQNLIERLQHSFPLLRILLL